MTDFDDLDLTERHTRWVLAMFEFVTDWHGEDAGMPFEVDQVLVRIVKEMRSHMPWSLTERDIQRVRLRVLSLATDLGKSPEAANMDLFAEFERQLRAWFLATEV